MMGPGVQIKFLWHDTDVIEVSITASNGEFGGAARAYLNHDDLKNAAAILAGFPNASIDSRELNLGNMEPQFAGGGGSFRFFCTGNSGHGVVEIRIVDEPQPETNLWTRPAQSVHFFADLEAAAIDDFVRELLAFDPYESPTTFLRFGTR